jgi:hypothetical protein
VQIGVDLFGNPDHQRERRCSRSSLDRLEVPQVDTKGSGELVLGHPSLEPQLGEVEAQELPRCRFVHRPRVA